MLLCLLCAHPAVFIGQNNLRRLLLLYASLDPEVGYCQGMGFPAALFLTYLSFDHAFYIFYSVLQRPCCPLRELYLPRLVTVKKYLFVFDILAKQHIPVLWEHLTNEGVMPSMFFTEWAMTLFLRGFDYDLVTRIWDIFLLEGSYKIIYRASLAILKKNEKLFMEQAFDKIMVTLRELPSYCDSEEIMSICWQIPLKTAHIKAAEQMVSERYLRCISHPLIIVHEVCANYLRLSGYDVV